MASKQPLILDSVFEGKKAIGVTRAVIPKIPKCGISVIESYHGPGFKRSELKDHFAKLGLVINGSGTIETSTGVFRLAPNVLFHIPAHVRHWNSDVPGDPVSVYVIGYQSNIVPAYLSKRLSDQGVFTRQLSGLGSHIADEFRSYLREMLFEQESRRTGWEEILQSRLLDFIVHTVRLLERKTQHSEMHFSQKNTSSERVAAYAFNLESRFFLDQSLNDAARATGLSRRRFTQIFRQITGCSWLDHVHDLRSQYAKKLLTHTNKSIIAVAFECGYQDLSHFYNLFKRNVGCSPASYREKTTKSKPRS
jgi:AraC-like DNA-binding protein